MAAGTQSQSSSQSSTQSSTKSPESSGPEGQATEHRVEDQIARIREDVAGLVDAVSDYGWDTAKRLRSGAQARLGEVTRTAEAQFDQVGKRVQTYERQVAQSVQERPLTALGLAAGAGFLLALLLRRR